MFIHYKSIPPKIFLNIADSNEKDLKFKVGDHLRISKYKNIFAKEYIPNWSEEIFAVKKKIRILLYGHMLLVI